MENKKKMTHEAWRELTRKALDDYREKFSLAVQLLAKQKPLGGSPWCVGIVYHVCYSDAFNPQFPPDCYVYPEQRITVPGSNPDEAAQQAELWAQANAPPNADLCTWEITDPQPGACP